MEIEFDSAERGGVTERAPRAPVYGRRRVSWHAGVAAAVCGVAVTSFVGVASATEPSEPATVAAEAPLEAQLRDAVDVGDREQVRALIDRGAYVFQVFADGTLVEHAVARCDVPVLAELERAGAARLDRVHGDDAALPHFLADCAPEATLAFLAYTGRAGSARDRMSLAVAHGSLALVNWLVATGCPTEVDGDWSALADAVRARRDDAVALLLEIGADPSARVGDATVAELATRGPATPFARAAIAEAARVAGLRVAP